MAQTETIEDVREHFGWADGLRGLAALAILGYEIARHAPNVRWANPLLARAAFASVHGFDALLVLSGLLLAYPVLAALRRDGRADVNLAAFAFGRALRILPAYYLILAATVIVPLAAGAYGIGGINHAAPAPRAAFLQALFAGEGLGNDGFAALGIQVRLLALFPILLAIYAFAPAILLALGGFALYLDFMTPLNHWGIGAAPGLMLGIVAADVLARRLAVARFAWPLSFAAAAGAFALDPLVASLSRAHGSPAVFFWNPLWAVAAAALAVACAQQPLAGRILGAHGLRQLSWISFALVLVADPVSSFALGHAGPGATWLALNAAGMSLIAAFGLWLIVDRTAATNLAARSLVRLAARPFAETALLSLGAPRPRSVAPPPAAYEVENRFGPLPTMHPGMLATVSQRFGSADDLRAEIEATKRRLADAAAAAAAGISYFEPEFAGVPEPLPVAEAYTHEPYALEGAESAQDPAEVALEGVLLGPLEPSARKVVTLALGSPRPQRGKVRIQFGPSLGGMRAS